MKKFILTFVLLFGAVGISYSQWTNNASTNTSIASLTGDQATPKIVSTSDGGCYIMWFDNRAGSYAVYLQRLNKYGVAQFAPNGLLISSNPQNSSLQDFNIDVDGNDNAGIVFTDVRNTIINPYAYLISPSGAFLWGPNGITLADTLTTQGNIPVVAATSDNNFVFAWSYGSGAGLRIAMQKYNINGVAQWGSAPVKLRGVGTENFNYMRMVKSDAGSIIMAFDSYTGNIATTGTIKLFTQKFSSSAAKLWTNPWDTVQNLARLAGISYIPTLVSDGMDGAIYTWVDDRDANSRQSAWVQRYSAAGVAYFPKNGSEASTVNTNNHFTPTSTILSPTSEIVTFWTETNGGQTVIGGLYGQKFNSAGVQQWGAGGKEFKSLDNNQLSFLSVYSKDTNAVVTYTESLFGSGFASVRGLATGTSGELHWPGSGIIIAASFSSGKIRKQSTMDKNSGMSVMTWSDNRSGGGDVLAQNLNLDGTLGINTLDVTFGIEGMWNGAVQVQDSVRFYLRSASAPYAIQDSSITYLNSSGNGLVYFSAPGGNFYVSTRHRSAIETWSANPISFTVGSTTAYDFTTSQTQTYGNNSILKSGRYCAYSGEIIKDGSIDLADVIEAFNYASAFATGYVAPDVNGDNIVDLTDIIITSNNASSFIIVKRP